REVEAELLEGEAKAERREEIEATAVRGDRLDPAARAQLGADRVDRVGVLPVVEVENVDVGVERPPLEAERAGDAEGEPVEVGDLLAVSRAVRKSVDARIARAPRQYDRRGRPARVIRPRAGDVPELRRTPAQSRLNGVPLVPAPRDARAVHDVFGVG